MELEKKILSKVTQTRKDKHGMYSLIGDIRHKVKNKQPKVHTPRKSRKEGDTSDYYMLSFKPGTSSNICIFKF